MAAKAPVKKEEDGFKLPKYLKLAKGAMWFDTDGENASGVKLYSVNSMFVGRGQETGERSIPRDKFKNANFVDYGYVDKSFTDFPWFVEVSTVPAEKQSRLILAYKHGILEEADPKSPPVAAKDKKQQAKDFEMNKKGERVFIGRNKEMFQKLQNLTMTKLREFVSTCPRTEGAKNNLLDMFHYEQLGYNKLARPRLEVIDLIRGKLREFGPTMSAIRVNED